MAGKTLARSEAARKAWFKRAVEAEVERRIALKPIHVRMLTIDFEERTFDIDGRITRVSTPRLVLPILSTEQLILPSHY